MQRWIVIGILVLCLLGGGGAFTLAKMRENKMNLSDRMWVPIPFNPESTKEQRDQSVETLRTALLTDERLAAVARDTGIMQKWNIATEAEAVADLRKRAIIEVGTSTINSLPTDTLNIGFQGIYREHDDLKILSERLMKDVQELLGGAGSGEIGAGS